MNGEEYIAEVDRAYALPPGGEQENRIRQICQNCAEEYGSEHPLYAAMLSELGSFYRGQGRLPESELPFQQAMEILAKSRGRDSADYATALNNLAGTHRREGKTELAISEFHQCMEIYQKAGQGETVLGASCLNNLALVYIDTGTFDNASEALSQAAEILKKFPEAKGEYASSLINLASVRFRLGEYAAAMQELSEAVTLLENEVGTQTAHYHAALNLLGILEEVSGQRRAAAEYYRRALSAAETLFGPDHPETAAIRYRLEHCPEESS